MDFEPPDMEGSRMNEESKPFQWDEKTFTKFTYLNDLRLSKKGEQVAYVVTKPNLDKNKYKKTIVIASLANGEEKYIKEAAFPRFSPNGRKLTFVRSKEENKTKELMLVDLSTMSTKKLLESENIFDVSWNQDNRRLLITSAEKLEDDEVYFEDKVPVWFDARGFITKENAVLQIFDTEAEETLDTIEIDFFVPPAVSTTPLGLWHGDTVVYNVPRREHPYKLYDIYRYEEGEREQIFEEVSFQAVDANGETVLLHGKPEKETHAEHNFLYLWENDGVTPLTEDFGYNIGLAKLDGQSNVYFTSYKEGSITLDAIKTAEGEKIPVMEENAWVTSFDVSDNGKVAFLRQSESEVNEGYLWDGAVRKFTEYNAPVLEKLSPKSVHHFSYEHLDREIDGWYMKPELEANEEAPVVVFVHGGPKGMYGYFFKHEMQLLANNGFYTMYVNPRGSNGYDEAFAEQVLTRTGREDFQDIMRGIEEFLNLEERADRDRVGITGISYGGFMTNWALTQSDLFKAGISENGISYWLTSYAFSDIGLWFDEEVVGENPLQNENYRELSPLFHVDNVEAPLLLIHSLQDYRCPIDQSVMFYHMLKERGKEAYISVFKKGAHGHSLQGSPKHRAKRYKLFLNFFERKLIEEKEGFNAEELLGTESKD